MIQECSVNDTHSEERQLRRCLRDLIAFTSLPLVWKDKTPREIANDLAAVLESTLGPEFVLVRITGPFAEEPIDAACTARRYPGIDAREISERIAPYLEREFDGQVADECRQQPGGGIIGKRCPPDARAGTPGKSGISATSPGDCPQAVALRSHHRKPLERRHSSYKLASDG